jgi:hypothetical protein
VAVLFPSIGAIIIIDIYFHVTSGHGINSKRRQNFHLMQKLFPLGLMVAHHSSYTRKNNGNENWVCPADAAKSHE